MANMLRNIITYTSTFFVIFTFSSTSAFSGGHDWKAKMIAEAQIGGRLLFFQKWSRKWSFTKMIAPTPTLNVPKSSFLEYISQFPKGIYLYNCYKNPILKVFHEYDVIWTLKLIHSAYIRLWNWFQLDLLVTTYKAQESTRHHARRSLVHTNSEHFEEIIEKSTISSDFGKFLKATTFRFVPKNKEIDSFRGWSLQNPSANFFSKMIAKMITH